MPTSKKKKAKRKPAPRSKKGFTHVVKCEAAIRVLLESGEMLSNICFNLKQLKDHVLTDREREAMRREQENWDLTSRLARKVLKGAR